MMIDSVNIKSVSMELDKSKIMVILWSRIDYINYIIMLTARDVLFSP